MAPTTMPAMAPPERPPDEPLLLSGVLDDWEESESALPDPFDGSSNSGTVALKQGT